MSERRNRQRMVGVYCQHPEEMLVHAISVTLSVAAAMYGGAGRKSLFSICCNEPMLRMAARKLYMHILREMAADYEPKPGDFDRLVQEVIAIAKES